MSMRRSPVPHRLLTPAMPYTSLRTSAPRPSLFMRVTSACGALRWWKFWRSMPTDAKAPLPARRTGGGVAPRFGRCAPTPSRAGLLYGTDEPRLLRRRLVAGPLEMEFENGALRWIRCGEVELLRGIFFLARDRNWGTLASRLTDIDLHQSKRSFRLAFKAECHGALGRLAWSGTMTGTEDGCVQLLGIAHPGEDFETARTGFILLHPLERVVGTPVEIEHGDGTRSLSRFPEEIRSDPLWTSIRSLCYEPARQLRFRCVMEGDLWECEDQRNWGDASF